MIKRLLWFFVFSWMAVSCLEEPDCFGLNNNIIGISFKKLSDKKADTVAFVMVTAAGTDSIFYETSLLTGGNFPLDYFSTGTNFTFSGVDGDFDLNTQYKVQTQFVSEDCGTRFVLTDLKAFSSAFDSVSIVGATPKSRAVGGANIEIFRCPNTSRIKLRFASAVTITNIEIDYEAPTILLSSNPVTTQLIPLNEAAGQSTIKFTFSDGTTTTEKTLVLSYDRATREFYHACGEQWVLSELTLDDHDFTSATIIRKTIQDPNEANIEITL